MAVINSSVSMNDLFENRPAHSEQMKSAGWPIHEEDLMGAAALTSIEAVSNWLYETRVARGISQEALAHSVGIAVPTYGRLERAALNGGARGMLLDTFIRIVVALEPDDDELAALLSSLRIEA